MFFKCIILLLFCGIVWTYAMELCTTINASLSPSNDSCLKIIYERLSWDDAFSYCINTAPNGTRGRLAHITSPEALEVFPLTQDIAPFIGLRSSSPVDKTTFVKEDWQWIDKFENGTTINKSVSWHTPTVALDLGGLCMSIWDGKFDGHPCSSPTYFICEYVQVTQQPSTVIMVLQLCLNQVCGCSEATTLTAKTQTCKNFKDPDFASLKQCIIDETTRLALVPQGQDTCLLIKSPEASTITNFLNPENQTVFYQLYRADQYDHFYTKSSKEAKKAVRVFHYELEGVLAAVANSPGDILVPCPSYLVKVLLELYYCCDPYPDHFYTTNATEAQEATRHGYKMQERNAGYCITEEGACGATWPLERYYASDVRDHFYTTEIGMIKTTMNMTQYVYEGVECYVWPLTAIDVMKNMCI